MDTIDFHNNYKSFPRIPCHYLITTAIYAHSYPTRVNQNDCFVFTAYLLELY